MKVKELHIHGFGKLQNFRLSNLSSGITLIEGENEAGKSTLMAFIRYILFGLPPARATENRYEPIDGTAMGGWMLCEDDDGTLYRIERTGMAARGKVVVQSEEGILYPDSMLERLRGGLSETIFREIFAFSLTELQQLKTLQNDELSSYLYGAGMGLGGVSIFDVEKQLVQQKEQLFKPRGSNPTVNTTLKKLEEIDLQLKKIRDENSTYNDLKNELAKLNESISGEEKKLDQMEMQLSFLEKAERCYGLWMELKSLQQELQDWTPIETFPEQAIQRLELLEKERMSLRVTLFNADQKITEIQNQLSNESLSEDEQRLIGDKDKIEHVYRSHPLIVEKMGRVRELEAEKRTIEARLSGIIQEMDPTWSEENVRDLNSSVSEKEKVRRFKEELATLQKSKVEVEKELEQFGHTIRELEQEHRALFGSIDRDNNAPLPESVEEYEKAVRNLERLQHQKDQELMRHDLLQKQDERSSSSAPSIVIPLFMSVLAGLIIITVLFLLKMSMLITIPIGIITASIVYLLQKQINAGAKIRSKRGDVFSELQQCRGQLAQLEKDIHQLSQLLGLTNVNEAVIDELYKEIDKRKKEAEQFSRLKEKADEYLYRLKKVESDSEKASKRKINLVERLENWNEAWKQELQNIGVSALVTPEGMLDFFHYGEQAKELIRRKDHIQLLLTEESNTVNKFITDTSTICECYEIPWSRDQWQRCIEQLKLKLEACVAKQSSVMKLQEKMGEAKAHHQEQSARLHLINESIEKLLMEGESTNEEQFRIQARLYEEYTALKKKHHDCQRELHLIAGGTEVCEHLFDYFSRITDERVMEGERKEVQETISEIRQLIDGNKRQAGKIEQSLENIANRGDMAELLLRKEQLVSELNEDVHRWATISICEHLCKKARETYEKERQPNVIRNASDYFRTMTEGKYEKILAGMEEKKLFAVLNNGARIEPHLLSRGTAEQMFVAMRFALIREYSRLSSMPIILDDVFVNFDRNRLRKTILALNEVSQHHQILFFTCHPHVTEMVKQEIHGMESISLSRQQALV